LERIEKPATNAILARAGLQLRGRQTYSERLVAVRLDPQRVEGHSLFWLTKTTPAGVTVEPDGDQSAVEEAAPGAEGAAPI
jgi:hypothetical protein